jgi:sulfur-oxidizing protein SoxX
MKHASMRLARWAAAFALAAAPGLVLAQSAETVGTLFKSFNTRGIASTDRLLQSDLQQTCTQVSATGKPLTKSQRDRIQKEQTATVKWPSDGKFLGDWREGERIAQNGRGMQFTDAAGTANGANCYACHQVSPAEISFGNQGPSLLQYGLKRNVKDPAAKESEAIVRYTWQRIWNTHSVSACSNMPRFGDAGILTEQQIKHVMALLLDPASPVNAPAPAAR